MGMTSALDRVELITSWPIRAVVMHFENRLTELMMACFMLVIAGWLAVFPSMLDDGGFRYLRDFVCREWLLMFFFIFGITRLGALIANGHWPFWGPIVRAACALVGAVLFGQMVLALVNLSKEGVDPPISTGVYAVLVPFELIAMYRALARGYGGRYRTQ